VRAVSEAEKNADKNTSKISTKVKVNSEPLNMFITDTFPEMCIYYKKKYSGGQIITFYVIIRP
jgi:hypothetical protein